MIDLHLHTTASDGNLDPKALVRRAYSAGIRALSVTDHDTMTGVPVADQEAKSLGVEFVPGIEITAVFKGRDVHILGYFLHPAPHLLASFLEKQRDERLRRARKICKSLELLKIPIDIDNLITDAEKNNRVITRPVLAKALLKAGHVKSEREAFRRWIGDGCPAYVQRQGSSPEEVVKLISKAGGVSVLAHPGLLRKDQLILRLVQAGLVGLEVHHPQHNERQRVHYFELAKKNLLIASGGSDYHGDNHHNAKCLGVVGTTPKEFSLLRKRLNKIHGVVSSER